MNLRAHDLTVLLRAILRSLPGGTAMCIHGSESLDRDRVRGRGGGEGGDDDGAITLRRGGP